MSGNSDGASIKALVDSLRADIGDSEFGYRMQSIFAHVLLELGYTVEEINQQGHPDIKAILGRQAMLVQVKTASHSRAGWVVDICAADVRGICPSRPDEVGYFAVLDCAVPVSWIVSEYHSIQRHVGRAVSIETVRASADRALSTDCTQAFAELLAKQGDRLLLLTTAILRGRALHGERL